MAQGSFENISIARLASAETTGAMAGAATAAQTPLQCVDIQKTGSPEYRKHAQRESLAPNAHHIQSGAQAQE
eukprot:2847973-Pyramimonas_sp.AAC.1